jgi:hypothetical protein
MSRKDLRGLAASFKQNRPPAEQQQAPAEDVTAQIERRLAEARQPAAGADDAASEPPAVEEPSLSAPSAPAEKDSPSVSTRAVTPTLRDVEPRRRVPVDIPVVFEPMRQQAGDRGITLTTLVLTALRVEGSALAERAQREGIVPVPADGFRRWTLLMSDSELDELDELTTALVRALGRRSRARTIALVLDAYARR